MYKTILAPLDGSQRAEAILPHLEEVARRYDATVILFQVVEAAPLVVGLGSAYAEQYRDAFEQQAKEVENYLTGLKEVFQQKGITVRIRVGRGPVADEIIKTAESEEADIIALASHGRSGLSKVFYGSVAASILHRIDRPLLLVRSG